MRRVCRIRLGTDRRNHNLVPTWQRRPGKAPDHLAKPTLLYLSLLCLSAERLHDKRKGSSATCPCGLSTMAALIAECHRTNFRLWVVNNGNYVIVDFEWECIVAARQTNTNCVFTVACDSVCGQIEIGTDVNGRKWCMFCAAVVINRLDLCLIRFWKHNR